MKKLRILLSVFAIVFAVGATFAMRLDTSMVGYKHIPSPGPGIPEECIRETAVPCQETAQNPCNLQGFDYKSTDTQTNCGPLLKKN